MMIFANMANSYSKMLGIRVKEGIKRKKEKGEYNGGRPEKTVDINKIKVLKADGLGLRTIALKYSEGLPKKDKISYQQVRRVLQKLSSNPQ